MSSIWSTHSDHVGQPRLRRPTFIPAALDKLEEVRTLVGAASRSTSKWMAASPPTMPRASCRPAPMCWSRVPPSSGAATTKANIAAIRNAGGRRRSRRAEEAAHDPALLPPRDDRDLVAGDAIPHLVRDRGARDRRDGRTRHHAQGSGEEDLGQGQGRQIRCRPHRRDRGARSSTTSSPS